MKTNNNNFLNEEIVKISLKECEDLGFNDPKRFNPKSVLLGFSLGQIHPTSHTMFSLIRPVILDILYKGGEEGELGYFNEYIGGDTTDDFTNWFIQSFYKRYFEEVS